MKNHESLVNNYQEKCLCASRIIFFSIFVNHDSRLSDKLA